MLLQWLRVDIYITLIFCYWRRYGRFDNTGVYCRKTGSTWGSDAMGWSLLICSSAAHVGSATLWNVSCFTLHSLKINYRYFVVNFSWVSILCIDNAIILYHCLPSALAVLDRRDYKISCRVSVCESVYQQTLCKSYSWPK